MGTSCTLSRPPLSRVALNVLFSGLDRKEVAQRLTSQAVAVEVWVAATSLKITALSRQAADATIWNLTKENCLRTLLVAEGVGLPAGNRVGRCAMMRVAKSFAHVSHTDLFRWLDRQKKKEIFVAASRYINEFNAVDLYLYSTAYGEAEVTKRVMDFIACNFSKVSITPLFVLLPKDCFFAVLKSPLLRTEKDCIFNAVFSWAQSSVPRLESDVHDLLEFVRYKFR